MQNREENGTLQGKLRHGVLRDQSDPPLSASHKPQVQ